MSEEMTNALEELYAELPEGVKIEWAWVVWKEFPWMNGPERKVLLNVGYSQHDFNDFLDSLNFNYDSEHGEQELFGTVFFEDGTWLERAEYDGAEWWEHKRWEHKRTPKFSDELRNQG